MNRVPHVAIPALGGRGLFVRVPGPVVGPTQVAASLKLAPNVGYVVRLYVGGRPP